MRRLVLLSILLSSTLLAGCVGTEDAPAPDPATGDDDVVMLDPVTGARTIVRPLWMSYGQMVAYEYEETFEGTFGGHEAGHPLAHVLALTGQRQHSLRSHDITDQVPKGIPTIITLELESDMTRGDLDVFLQAPDGEIWSTQSDTPRGGRSMVRLYVVHAVDEPIVAHVWYDEAEPVASFSYRLDVRVENHPSFVLGGVPVLIDVPRGTVNLELRYEQAPERVWLWDPRDELVATMAPNGTVWNHTFAADAARGAYVLMLPGGAAPTRVSLWTTDAEARASPLRNVRQVIEFTEERRFQANEPVTYTYDALRVPLQTGFFVALDQATKDAEMTLSSPEGELLRMRAQDDLPFFSLNPQSGPRFGGGTSMGAEGLVAGSYAATFTGSPHGPGSIGAWLVGYARS